MHTLLHDPPFQIPFPLSDLVRRPATASILDGPAFVLPAPPVPPVRDPLVYPFLPRAVPQLTSFQPTPPPRMDGYVSDYTPLSGMHLCLRFADPD